MRFQSIKRMIVMFFLGFSFLISIYIRTKGTPLNLQGIYGTDPPRYISQAKMILELGKMPEREMLREFPLGRRTSTQLTLFAYTLAFLYWFVNTVGIPLSLEQVAILSPVLFYVLSLGLVCLISWKFYGIYTALLAINFLSFSPYLIGRTMAGYADRDSLTLFLALTSYLFYLLRFTEKRFFQQYVLVLCSSFTMVLLGLTWPGVGIFIAVVVTLELIRLISARWYDSKDLIMALSFLLPICVLLPLVKEAYRFWVKPYALLAIGYPIVAILGILLTFILQHKRRLSDTVSIGGRIPLGLSVIGFSLMVGVSFLSVMNPNEVIQAVKNLSNPVYSTKTVAETISELQKTGALAWVGWPGVFFIAILAGILLSVWEFSIAVGMNPWYTSILFELWFSGIAFSRIFSGMELSFKETPVTLGIYWSSLALGGFGLIFLFLRARLRKESGHHSSKLGFEINLFMVIWALVMFLGMRSAIRFAALFVIPGTILGAYAIIRGIQWILGSRQLSRLVPFLLLVLLWESYAISCATGVFPLGEMRGAVYILLAVLTGGVILYQVKVVPHKKIIHRFILGLLLIYLIGLNSITPAPWLGGYGIRDPFLLKGRLADLHELNLEESLRWLRENTPKSAVVAAFWEYGSWINLLGERASVVDEQQNNDWIYLMSRLIFSGQDEKEALEFLKSHSVTHLLLTRRDINNLKILSKPGLTVPMEIAYFGSVTEKIEAKEEPEKKKWKPFYRYYSSSGRFLSEEFVEVMGEEYAPGEWAIESIYLAPEDSDKMSALVELNLRGKIVRLPPQEVIQDGKVYECSLKDVIPCTLLIYSPQNEPESWHVFYFSPRARQTLSIRLFVFHELPEIFELVYPPQDSSPDFTVQIWKIHYPPDIDLNPLYVRPDYWH